MPPKTRGSKATKVLKENATFSVKNKLKSSVKVTNVPRKVLADKTNSASDDNALFDCRKNVSTRANTPLGMTEESEIGNQRPRRERRLPKRYIGNNLLNNSHIKPIKSKIVATSNFTAQKTETENHSEIGSTRSKRLPKKYQDGLTSDNRTLISSNKSSVTSPKNPQQVLENSLIVDRPKRISRLPSKLKDHLLSPSNKLPSVQPCHASTPIAESKKSEYVKSPSSNTIIANENSQKTQKAVLKEKKPDTNNNASRSKLLQDKIVPLSEAKISSPKPKKEKKSGKKLPNKNFSFRILEDKKTSVMFENNPDIYEFTYDPNEEPPPQKKKRKKVVRKNKPKPKIVVFKSNYNFNLSKTLTNLKKTISTKSTKVPINDENTDIVAKDNDENVMSTIKSVKNADTRISKVALDSNINSLKTNAVQVGSRTVKSAEKQNDIQNTNNNVDKNPSKSVTNDVQSKLLNEKNKTITQIGNDSNIINDYNDINYSPVSSPNHLKSSMSQAFNTSRDHSPDRPNTPMIFNNDPLNLQDNMSDFDDLPIASSSMNVSARHPEATPWRVEFENLPIKWHVNTYVKPDMTPAFESSFINFDDDKNKKRHVYTNIGLQVDNTLPKVMKNNVQNLKQTSIVSFIKEVAEKRLNKKKREKSRTPVRDNSIFDDISNIPFNTNDEYKTPKKLETPKKSNENNTTPIKKSTKNVSNSSEDKSLQDKENLIETRKRKKYSDSNEVPMKKTPGKQKDYDNTLFGFDDSENQENVSPNKKVDNNKVRALRPRSRAVLKEINEQKGPTRAFLPVAAKSKFAPSTEAVNKLYEELKSAADAPVFPENNTTELNVETTNINHQSFSENVNNDEDSQSVHLFEDLELVHHLKANRKSYGKAKKVAFQATSISDDESPNDNAAEQAESSDEEFDNLDDITFQVPKVQRKKVTRKKKETKKEKLFKKEEKEAEEWAAGFNSMCEDVEEFPLVVE